MEDVVKTNYRKLLADSTAAIRARLGRSGGFVAERHKIKERIERRRGTKKEKETRKIEARTKVTDWL